MILVMLLKKIKRGLVVGNGKWTAVTHVKFHCYFVPPINPFPFPETVYTGHFVVPYHQSLLLQQTPKGLSSFKVKPCYYFWDLAQMTVFISLLKDGVARRLFPLFEVLLFIYRKHVKTCMFVSFSDKELIYFRPNWNFIWIPLHPRVSPAS